MAQSRVVRTLIMSSMAGEMDILEDPEEKACREAFEYYDWNNSGTIPFSVMSRMSRKALKWD